MGTEGRVLAEGGGEAGEDADAMAWGEEGEEGVMGKVDCSNESKVSFPVTSLLGCGLCGNCSLTGCDSRMVPILEMSLGGSGQSQKLWGIWEGQTAMRKGVRM